MISTGYNLLTPDPFIQHDSLEMHPNHCTSDWVLPFLHWVVFLWSGWTPVGFAIHLLKDIRCFPPRVGLFQTKLHRTFLDRFLYQHKCSLLWAKGLRGQSLAQTAGTRLVLWNKPKLCRSLLQSNVLHSCQWRGFPTSSPAFHVIVLFILPIFDRRVVTCQWPF